MSRATADVAGKGVLVTGGSAGLGLAMAEALVRGGGRVVVTGRDSARGAEAERQLRGVGSAWFLAHDAAGEEDWSVLLDEVVDRAGRLDAIVNNVGLNDVKPLTETSYADFLRIARINLFTAWRGTVQGARRMRSAGSGGSIVNIASMAARYANAQVAPYCAAKAMVGGLSRAAATEFAPYGVRVNAIYPGIFLTDLTRRMAIADEAARVSQLARIPMGRFGAPEELGGLACFLVSDASRAISGADFLVDGGRTAW